MKTDNKFVSALHFRWLTPIYDKILSCTFPKNQIKKNVTEGQLAVALPMAKEANINDPEIKKLIREIISSQQKEIDFVKVKIKELNNK